MKKVYISLLRGINVSGHYPIKMDALRQLYESLGFEQVSTYVQSGNVVFSAKRAADADLAQSISQRIKEELDYSVPVLVLDADKLKVVIESNPFVKEEDLNPAFLHVTFLASKPMALDQQKIEEKLLEGEKVYFSDKAIYLYCPKGYGNTKLNNNFFESKLKVQATTRNWKTTNTLLEMAEAVK